MAEEEQEVSDYSARFHEEAVTRARKVVADPEKDIYSHPLTKLAIQMLVEEIDSARDAAKAAYRGDLDPNEAPSWMELDS